MKNFRPTLWLLIRIALALGAGAAPADFGQSLATPEQLQALLKRFPDADTNHDGVLTEEEALAYATKARAARSNTARASLAPEPTFADVAYGPAARNTLDFWRASAASAEHPVPLVIYIHGGGFLAGNKTDVRRDRLVQQCLDAGVSFASLDYRYLAPGVPLQDILRDCARAVQFLRTKAADWHIDQTRVAAYGGSAGAGASLWLAFHDDLADLKNSDPVLRESSRLMCAGAISPQASYDWNRWPDLVGQDAMQRFAGPYNFSLLYGFSPDEIHSPAAERIAADCDMLALASKDDPPVFISSSLPDLSLINSNQFLHHPKHGKALYDRCREAGISVVASIPAFNITPPKDGPATWHDFLFQQLGIQPASASSISPTSGRASDAATSR